MERRAKNPGLKGPRVRWVNRTSLYYALKRMRGIMPGAKSHPSLHLRGPRPCFISWLMFAKVPRRRAGRGAAGLAARLLYQTRELERCLGTVRLR